jgi:hypothetical protein
VLPLGGQRGATRLAVPLKRRVQSCLGAPVLPLGGQRGVTRLAAALKTAAFSFNPRTRMYVRIVATRDLHVQMAELYDADGGYRR